MDVQQAKLVNENIGCFDKSAYVLIRFVFDNSEILKNKSLYYRVNAEHVAVKHDLDIKVVKLVTVRNFVTIG